MSQPALVRLQVPPAERVEATGEGAPIRQISIVPFCIHMCTAFEVLAIERERLNRLMKVRQRPPAGGFRLKFGTVAAIGKHCDRMVHHENTPCVTPYSPAAQVRVRAFY